MKRTLSLILALCFCLTLAACGSDPEPTTVPTTEPANQPTTQPTAAPTEPDNSEPTTGEVVYDLPMTAISMTQQKEVTNGKDGNPVFEYTYQNIRVVLPDGDMALDVTLDILNRIDATRPAANDLMNDAVSANPQYPYSFSIIYEPQRLDSGVLSLFGRQSIYSGGSVFHAGHGMTYDLATGKALTLADVLENRVTADVICPLVIEAIRSLPEEYYIFDDFETTVEDRFAVDFRADAGWHLSDDGLCFTFLPYEVAPNSTGFVHALIPYEKLSGILKDAYFPAERVTPDGQLEVSAFLDDNTENFDQFAELNLDRIGGTYLLHSTGLIYDLVIETGFWNMDGTVFTPEATVFDAGSMVPSDAIKVQTDIPDTLPHLRITYTGAEGTVTLYLSASGEDGTPLLLTY